MTCFKNIPFSKTAIAAGLCFAFSQTQAIPVSQLDFNLGNDKPIVKSALLNLGKTNLIKTTPSGVKELILKDGSVLTVGLDSEVVVSLEKYVTRVDILRGSLRLTSGSYQPVYVSAPACNGVQSIISNASGFFDTGSGNEFTAFMIYGKKIDIENQNRKLSLVKAGFGAQLIQTNSQCELNKPSRLAVNEISALLLQTETSALALAALAPTASGSTTENRERDGSNEVSEALSEDESTQLAANTNDEEPSNETEGNDTGGTDTGGTDTGETDTGGTDTGETDTVGTDTGGTDTGGTDTGGTDTGGTDTGGTDTGGTDTGGTDTGGTDTGGTDTGGTDAGGTDTGGTDTGGTDTGGTDAGGTDTGGTDTGGTDTGGTDTGGTDTGGTDTSSPTPDPLDIPDRGGDIADADTSADGFGPGESVNAPDLADAQVSQTNTLISLSEQIRVNVDVSGIFDGCCGQQPTNNRRARGRTTNRLYSLNQGVNNLNDYTPIALEQTYSITAPSANLGYIFTNPGTLSFGLVAFEDRLTYAGGSSAGPSIVFGITLPENGGVYSETSDIRPANFVPDLPTPDSDNGYGGPYQYSNFSLLAAGFNNDTPATSSSSSFNITRNPDNFIFFQALPGLSDLSGPDLSDVSAYIFAAGDVDGRLSSNGFTGPQFSVDQFHLGTGINVCANNSLCVHTISGTVQSGIRSFGRLDTAMGLSLTDSGLLIVNQETENTDNQTALLHVDFAWSGEGSNQSTTISSTIGDLTYDQVTLNDTSFCGGGNADCSQLDSIEVSAEGQTIGSSLGDIHYDDVTLSFQRELISFTSPFRLTAAGGNNPELERQGYAGYLVLENYDPNPQFAVAEEPPVISPPIISPPIITPPVIAPPVLIDPVLLPPSAPQLTALQEDAPLLGGTESTIGNSLEATNNNVDYAQIRLATANGNTGNGSTSDTYLVGTRSNTIKNGWVGGLAIREEVGVAGVTVRQIDNNFDAANVTITSDAATNRVEASLGLYDASNPSTLNTIQLGGLTGEETKGASAFVDDNNYAIRTNDSDSSAQLAMVSSGLVEAGLPANSVANYEHVQWGFFFGDIKTSATEREHVHLGSWVAGDQTLLADLPTTGTASYGGHAIGNVYSAGEHYTAIGSYNNSWDFGTRRGTATMNFDNAQYSGETEIRDGSVAFDGVINGTDRTGALHGSFVQGGGDPTAAVMGQFSIQNTAGEDYRAVGTFAGEKQ